MLVSVYGFIDAPVGWRQTLCEFLYQEGFRPNLMCPCFWTWRGEDKAVIGQLCIEVDDLMMAGKGERWAQFKARLQARFEFGKWV